MDNKELKVNGESLSSIENKNSEENIITIEELNNSDFFNKEDNFIPNNNNSLSSNNIPNIKENKSTLKEIKDVEETKPYYKNRYDEQPKGKVTSTWEDAFNVVNPFAIDFNNVNIEVSDNNYDDNFDKEKYFEDNQVSEDEKLLIYKNAHNEQYADSLLKRNRTYQESLDRIGADDSIAKYGKMLIAGTIDPTILVPFGGAVSKVNSLVKANELLTRVATTGLTYGSIGAITNVASESLFDLQNLPTDYTSAATLGFVLGGGLPMIGEAVSYSMFSNKIAKSLREPSFEEKHLEQDNEIIQHLDENGEVSHTEFVKKDDTEYVEYEDKNGKIKKRKKTKAEKRSEEINSLDDGSLKSSRFIPQVLNSLSNKLHEVKDKTTQYYIRKAVAPTVSAKDSNGNYIVKQESVEDLKTFYRGFEQKYHYRNAVSYNNAVKDGYFNGTKEEWDTGVKLERDRLESLRQKDIQEELNTFKNSLEEENTINKEEIYNNELQSYAENVSKKKNIPLEKALKDKSIIKKAKTNTENKVKKLEEKLNKEHDKKISEFRKELEKKYTYKDYLTRDNTYYNGIIEANNFFEKYRKEGMKYKEDFKDIDGNGLYNPRQYDWRKIEDIDEFTLKNIFKKAMEEYKSKENLELIKNPKEFDKVLDEIVQEFKKNANKKELQEFMELSGRQIDGLQNINHFLKSRKYGFDNYALKDILDNDMNTIIQKYNFRMAPDLALSKQYGTSNIKTIKNNLVKDLENNSNFDKKEIVKISEDFEKVLENLTGVTSMKANLKNPNAMRIVRYAGMFNTLTLGGKFGLNTVNEIVNGLVATQSKELLYKNFGKQLKDTVNIMNGKEADSLNTELVEIIGMSPELVDSHVSMKIQDNDSVFSSSKIEKVANKLVNRLMTYNGMKVISGYFQGIVAGNALQDIRKFAKILNEGKTLSDKQKLLMSRWGLEEQDVLNLNKTINNNAKFKENGTIEKLNLHKWENSDEYLKMSIAIKRAVESGIMRGDSIHLPQWMLEGSPMVRLAFEFLRFPIIATQTLLRRGMQEDMAGFVASAIGASLVFVGSNYLVEQAEVSIGVVDKHKTKYNIFEDEEQFKKAFLKSLNYVGSLGATTLAYDKVMIMLGYGSFGREYADDISSLFGVSASRLEQFKVLFHNLLEGKYDSEQTWYVLKSLTPFLSLPVISEGANLLIKKYGE